MNTQKKWPPSRGSFVWIGKKPVSGSLYKLHKHRFTDSPSPWHHSHSPSLHLLGKHHSQNEVHSRGDPRENLPGKQEPHVAGGGEKPALHKAQLDEVGHEQLNPRLIPAGCSTSLKRKPWRGEQAEGHGPGPVLEHSNRHLAVGIMNSEGAETK